MYYVSENKFSSVPCQYSGQYTRLSSDLRSVQIAGDRGSIPRQGNLKFLLFFIYLIAMVFYIPLFNYTSILYIHYLKPKSKILSYFILWCFIQWIFVICLLYYMIQSIGMSQTTRERIKKPYYLKKNQNLFNKGFWFTNLLQYYKEMFSYQIKDKYSNEIELRNNCQIYFK